MAPNTKRKVMLIDDDHDHLFVTRSILEKEGFDVSTFHSCEDLITNVKGLAPGLIFMDIQLSGMSGSEAAQMLKTDTRLRDIPVVLFSGAHDIAEQAKESGADGWLSKPFDSDNLVKCAGQYCA